MNDLYKNNSVNEIKQQVETIKENGTLVKSNNQKSEKSKTQISKAKPEKKSHIEIIENLGMEKEWGRINKDENIKVKIRKYPGTSSIDILDHIKPSLRIVLEQIKRLLKRLYFIRIFKLYFCKEQVLYYVFLPWESTILGTGFIL